jgi:hypothetical protein
MKYPLVCFFVVGLVFFFTSCAENTAGQQDGRLGARAGVAASSRDMSRVTPTRPEAATTN